MVPDNSHGPEYFCRELNDMLKHSLAVKPSEFKHYRESC